MTGICSPPEAISGFMDSVYHNPVTRGLCEKAIDGNWSSARCHLLDPPRQQFPGLPRIHGPPPGIFDRRRNGHWQSQWHMFE